MEEKLLAALNQRYATKRFDASKKLDPVQLETLIESVRLTATSYGLQLMKLVIVENETLRSELMTQSYDQKQIAESSHLLILCRERKLDPAHFKEHAKNISLVRSVPPATLERMEENWMNAILTRPLRDQENWMEKQVYIALGSLLTSAAVIGVDACPMEGFKTVEFDRILGLEKLNLASVLAVPVGFRSADDSYASMAKVRRKKDDFVIRF